MSSYILRIAVVTPILFWASYTDFKRHRIENKASASIFICGILILLWAKWDISPQEVFVSAVIVAALGLVLYMFGQGAGDGKLFTSLAIIFGFRVFFVMGGAYFVAGIFAAILRLLKLVDSESKLPLAPAISCVAILFLILTYAS